ncbi:MAG: hypothetical protein MJZ24_04180 [Paludibacteraceae bacterium]|nr:hypothetical protein [Paludibacteraceae bacterium]
MNITKLIFPLVVFGFVQTAAAQNKCELPEQYISESEYVRYFKIGQDQKIDWRYAMHLSKEVKTVKCRDQWFIFDKMGRLVEASFMPDDTARYTYEYDKKKKETKQICSRGMLSNVSTFNENGILIKVERGGSAGYVRKYDSLNRIQYQFNGLQSAVDSFFYAKDGSCCVKTYGGVFFDYDNAKFNFDRLRLEATVYFDKHGNVVKQVGADGNVESKSFKYTYHPNGRVKTCTNEEEQWVFDDHGILLSINDANTGKLVYPGVVNTYDENGNILVENGKLRNVYVNGVRQRIEVIENGKVVRTLHCDKYGNQLEDESGTLFSLTYF